MDMTDFANDILLNPVFNPAKKDVKLPCSNCNGECCEPIPLKDEFVLKMYKKYNLGKILGEIGKQKFVLTPIPGTKNYHHEKYLDVCLFKGEQGCMIYEDRPSVCRAYGQTELLNCAYEGLDKQPDSIAERKRLVGIKCKKDQTTQLSIFSKMLG